MLIKDEKLIVASQIAKYDDVRKGLITAQEILRVCLS